MLVAGCVFDDPGGGDDHERVLRRYVAAWAEGGDELARTITGRDASQLLNALEPLRESGVVRTSLVEVSDSNADTVTGTVALRFADDGELQVEMHARIADERVEAEPSAIASELTAWEELRVETSGRAPDRGDVLSRSGTLLARGPKARRVAPRPALLPAVVAIDDAIDVRLGGAQGRRLVAGEPPQVLADSKTVDGENVRTSLDDEMQAAAEAALGDISGAFVAVDPRTGGIRALVSNATAAEPKRSPATSGYSPGSAFKIVTAAAALEEGDFDAGDTVPCPSRIFVDERFITNFESTAYGSITLEKAFTVSCNTAFAQVGMRVGTIPLMRAAEHLGFRVAPQLDGAGTIAVPRSRAELGVVSFGAAGSLVSPVQMAGIGATLARGGTWLDPGWTDRDEAGQRALSDDTADALVGMMEQVVENGTGTNAAVPGARVAGKTGTAEPAGGGRRSDAWFVGLAPSRDTQIVAVAFLLGAGIGGDVAAPVVRDFLVATQPDWK